MSVKPLPGVPVCPIGDLKPHPRNAKRHPESQVKLLARSLEKYGWTRPVLVDGDNTIIAGHGVVQAAKLLELTEVPVVRRKDLTENEIRAYLIADNKLAELSTWDPEILPVELADLADPALEHLGLADLGFSDHELKGLLGDNAGAQHAASDVHFGVVVICKGSAHQELVRKELEKLGYDCRLLGERQDEPDS